ncbi:hypothetical protein [Amycolatopsis viridis]|uniref:Uncharacterized protein n=1 Tax=Amycolatopsis viridis TaxID=185678 RepID=A0ABX0SXG4_9PSEU|nr:hypothetical protein [Amycolatopsis viridis]NIH81663.1 hypothetical protein [Amycolatopsis viridis]
MIATIGLAFAALIAPFRIHDYHCQTGKHVSEPGHTDKCAEAEVYVKDRKADSRAALAAIRSYAAGDPPIRFCRNNHGNGTWAVCTFNWPEGPKKEVHVGALVSYTNLHTDYKCSFSNN